jgi:hypothetical protein
MSGMDFDSDGVQTSVVLAIKEALCRNRVAARTINLGFKGSKTTTEESLMPVVVCEASQIRHVDQAAETLVNCLLDVSDLHYTHSLPPSR